MRESGGKANRDLPSVVSWFSRRGVQTACAASRGAIAAARLEIAEVKERVELWASAATKTLDAAEAGECELCASELRESANLEELLRLLASFPASLNHYELTNGFSPGSKGRARMGSEERARGQLLQVRSSKAAAGGASITTDWAGIWCEIQEGGILAMFVEKSGQGDALHKVHLKNFVVEVAGGGSVVTPGVREFGLRRVADGGGGTLLGTVGSWAGVGLSMIGLYGRSAEQSATADGEHEEYNFRAENSQGARAWVELLMPLCSRRSPEGAVGGNGGQDHAPGGGGVGRGGGRGGDDEGGREKLGGSSDDHDSRETHSSADSDVSAAAARMCTWEGDASSLDVWGVLDALAKGAGEDVVARLGELHRSDPRQIERCLPQVTKPFLPKKVASSTCR